MTIILGMAVFVPFDGKRVRLRNTPFPDDSSEEGGGSKMNLELPLLSDHRIRIVSSGAVFSGSHKGGGTDDNQDGEETGEKMYHSGGATLNIIYYLLYI